MHEVTEFKNYLRTHLVTSGVKTQSALSEIIAMDYGQLNKIFTGKTKRPEPETVKLLAAALGRPEREALLAAGWPASFGSSAGRESFGPRVVRVITRRGEIDVELDRAIAFVEAKPDPDHQEMIKRWQAGMARPDYERVVLRLYLAWDSNEDAVRETVETLRPDLAPPGANGSK